MVTPLVQETTGRHLDGGGEFFQRRDLRVALSVLDPADLACLDATALGNLFLGQVEFLARGAQVLSEIAHMDDRLLQVYLVPCKVL